MKKRIICTITVVIMLMTMLLSVCQIAYAAGGEDEVIISKIVVSDMKAAVGGNSADNSAVKFNAYVKGADEPIAESWLSSGELGWYYEDALFTGIFDGGLDYTLKGKLICEAGFKFDEDTELMLDGEHFGYTLKSENTELYVNDSVYSEYTYIEEAYIEDALPEFEIGNSAVNCELKVPENVNYKAKAQWYLINDEFEYIEFEGVFEEGELYSLEVTLVEDKGYSFLGELYVNGEKVDDGDLYVTEDGNTCFERIFTTAKIINEVSFDYSPEPELGMDTKNFKVTLPKDATYTAKAVWYIFDETADDYVEYNGKLTDDLEYYLEIELKPKDGYYFDYFMEEVTVNGEASYSFYGDYKALYYSEDYVFDDEIYEIELEGYTEPKVGDKIEDFNASVSKDAPYTFKAVWMDEEFNELTSGTLENGNKYYLALYFEAKPGNIFSEYVEVYLDGEYYEDESAMFTDYVVLLAFEFSYLKKIENYSLCIDKLPAADKKVTCDGIYVPEGEHYSISEACWYDYNSYKEAKFFKEGGRYIFVAELVAEEGYEFAEDAKFSLKCDENLQIEADSYGDVATVSFYYSLCEEVNEINITGVTPAKVGEMPTVEGIKASADSHCIIKDAFWMENDLSGGYYPDEDEDYSDYYEEEMDEEFKGPFEDGKLYSLVLELSTEDGYDFAPDTKIFFNGEQGEGMFMVNIGSGFIDYPLGLTPIDKAELEVSGYEAGADAFSVEITAPEDANYTVGYVQYLSYEDIDDYNGYEYVEDVFEPGTKYLAFVELIPKEGYYFVNGFTAEAEGCGAQVHEATAFSGIGDVEIILPELCDHDCEDYLFNENAHWMHCELCGNDVYYEEHIIIDGECVICGYEADGGAEGDTETDDDIIAEDKNEAVQDDAVQDDAEADSDSGNKNDAEDGDTSDGAHLLFWVVLAVLSLGSAALLYAKCLKR